MKRIPSSAMKSLCPLALALLPAIDSSALAQRAETPQEIVIGSKAFTENRILAEIMAQLIENNTALRVSRRANLGGTKVVFAALQAGEIDIYPEYTGAALIFFEGDERATVENFKDAEMGYELAKEMDAENGIVWLEPARANNTWALCCTGAFAEENGLKTMSDFADYVNGK